MSNVRTSDFEIVIGFTEAKMDQRTVWSLCHPDLRNDLHNH